MAQAKTPRRRNKPAADAPETSQETSQQEAVATVDEQEALLGEDDITAPQHGLERPDEPDLAAIDAELAGEDKLPEIASSRIIGLRADLDIAEESLRAMKAARRGYNQKIEKVELQIEELKSKLRAAGAIPKDDGPRDLTPSEAQAEYKKKAMAQRHEQAELKTIMKNTLGDLGLNQSGRKKGRIRKDLR